MSNLCPAEYPVQLASPAVPVVAGQVGCFNGMILSIVKRNACGMLPFGFVGVPVPITSSAVGKSGRIGSPAASVVPYPNGGGALLTGLTSRKLLLSW